MKHFKFTTLGLAALMLASSLTPAFAQAPSVQYGASFQQASNRATVIGLVPASSATDIFTISGTVGKNTQIKKIHCAGVSTAAATALVQVVKRSTLDTGGTSTTATNTRLNANNTLGTAIVKAYTANPTLGTVIGTLDAGYLTTNTLASSAIQNDGITFDFTNQWAWIIDATTQIAVNLNGVSPSAGTSLTCTVEWDEQ